MRHRRRLAGGAAIAAALITCVAEAAATGPQTQPAQWMPEDLTVSLHNLPKRYSCDALSYKFRDVLLAIGAQPRMSIQASRCEPADPAARSPSVHLRFSIPRVLPASQARWPHLEVVSRTVRLGPGHPRSLDDSDCELMRQMKDALLESLSQRIVSFNLACVTAAASRWGFNVSLQALEPVSGRTQIAVADQSSSDASRH